MVALSNGDITTKAMIRSKDYTALINTKRWRRLRAFVLKRYPLCRECLRQGRTTAATEVHHLTPIESAPTAQQRERLAYDVSNLEPLCHNCHVEVHRRAGKSSREENERRNALKLNAFIERFLK